ncbi:MAG: Na+/H+ antiporter subunit E [Pseudomonadota bacterium]
MPRSPLYFALLIIILSGTWLLLSGVYKPRLVITGLAVCVAVAWVIDRIQLLDDESLPLAVMGRAVGFWAWLGLEIIKSGWHVTKIIINPALPIKPTMITFSPTQKTATGLTTHGNSITLTPGTITTGISSSGGYIQVHAIEREGAEGCLNSEMDRRVTHFENAKEKAQS